MMKSLNILFTIQLLICLNSLCINAQDTTNGSGNYSIFPHWIKMMDDPNTNYYEAMKAFDEYFTAHEMPVMEEEEKMGQDNDVREMQREVDKKKITDKSIVLTEEELKKKNEGEVLKYHIKRFKRWRRDVKPFVQEDGRILTDEERQQIWMKQQEEINEQDK